MTWHSPISLNLSGILSLHEAQVDTDLSIRVVAHLKQSPHCLDVCTSLYALLFQRAPFVVVNKCRKAPPFCPGDINHRLTVVLALQELPQPHNAPFQEQWLGNVASVIGYSHNIYLFARPRRELAAQTELEVRVLQPQSASYEWFTDPISGAESRPECH
jgi:hypothetical protein